MHSNPSPKEQEEEKKKVAATEDSAKVKTGPEDTISTIPASGSWLPIFSRKSKKSENDSKQDILPDTHNLSSSANFPVSSKSEPNIIPGEPVVKHGWTLTSSVGFRAVCRTIAKEAFKVSRLPVIVSLEVHADLGQQEIMVKVMKEEWGETLIQEPINNCNPNERLPRLEEILGKILVKVKRGSPQKTKTTFQRNIYSETKDSKYSSDESSLSSSSDDEKTPGQVVVKTKISEILGNLGVYTYSERFKDFGLIMKPTHIFSIGESDVINLSKNQDVNGICPLFTHNRNFIMRTYPSGIRINSSNPSPVFFWRQGIQIVAMNWQKIDDGMMLNEAMFFGEDGWVLKPAGYHHDTSEMLNYTDIELKITLLAGQLPSFLSGKASEEPSSRIQCELHVENKNKATADEDNNNQSKGEINDIKGHEFDIGGNGSLLLQFQSRNEILEEFSFVK